jgi:hypothetical protein
MGMIHPKQCSSALLYTSNSILGNFSVCVFRTMLRGFEPNANQTVGASLLAMAQVSQPGC